MAELNLETVIKSGVEKALNKPIVDGKSITEWAAIGMKAPRWISVKDEMPEDETEVIIIVQHKIGWYRAFAWHDEYGWHSSAVEFGDGESDFVTHWLSLPEPPEGVSGGG